MRKLRTSGSVRGEGGNILTYSALSSCETHHERAALKGRRWVSLCSTHPTPPSKQFRESSGEADAVYRRSRTRAPAVIARGKRRACAGLNRANNRNRDRSLNARRETGEPRATQYHRGGSIFVRTGIARVNEAIQGRRRIASDLIP